MRRRIAQAKNNSDDKCGSDEAKKSFPTEKKSRSARPSSATETHRLWLFRLISLVGVVALALFMRYKYISSTMVEEDVVISSFHETQQELFFKWVVSNGGYFNPKQEARYGDDGLFGMFASQPIAKEDLLTSIPWDCVVGSETYGRFKNCETVEILAQELDKNESIYAQILHQTLQNHRRVLPTNWSKQGKELLLKVTGNGTLPPQDPFMNDFSWKKTCDQISKDATALVLTHGEDFGMVPITDIYNCRGGNYTGAYFSIYGGDDDEAALEVRALRDIEPGEEIYTNYKDYTDYRGGQVGTPELLRDYGFVELYPQRYIFPSYDIAFDIRQRANGDIEIEWLEDILEDEHVIDFLQKQVIRLNEVYTELQEIRDEDSATIPKHELQAVTRFCRDYKTAISRAIQEAD